MKAQLADKKINYIPKYCNDYGRRFECFHFHKGKKIELIIPPYIQGEKEIVL